jgi:formate/nitrite transporter FocA (FNT family)
MTVFLAIFSREIISKIVAIWFPVMCFVGLGTDHVIANMYFIPLAIFLGSPDITAGYYIWKSMIPSFLGNFVGGGLFTGVCILVFAPRRRRAGRYSFRSGSCCVAVQGGCNML